MAEAIETPIVYPTITVPGKGTYVVKFGAAVAFRLERDHGMDPLKFVNALRQWLPHEDPANPGQFIAGRSSLVFLFNVLSACLWKQTNGMSAEDLADAFDGTDLSLISPVILEAFSKAQRPAAMRLQESAASVKEPSAPVLN